MKIVSASYKTSVIDANNLLNDGVPEFAFVGRSNVGKSSLINMLTGVKGLAKTSGTPGKTRMVNYFDINNQFRFVDLPGYGFAKVEKSHLDVWSSLMGQYLQLSPQLLTTFVLLDIRHEPTSQDKQMINFLVYYGLPFMIIATKADKIAKTKVRQAVGVLAKSLNLRADAIIPTSSESAYGKDKLLSYIENKLAGYY